MALTGTSHSLIGPAAAIVPNIPHTQTSSLSVKLVRVDESTQSDGKKKTFLLKFIANRILEAVEILREHNFGQF